MKLLCWLRVLAILPSHFDVHVDSQNEHAIVCRRCGRVAEYRKLSRPCLVSPGWAGFGGFWSMERIRVESVAEYICDRTGQSWSPPLTEIRS